ncbi:MAG: response regulator transcription factor [Winogradskyella sp.]|nr:response regulator transcription factor [Winogradskyella sp.]
MPNQNTISCLIVDDEIASQRVLEHFVAETDVLKLQGVCSNTKEALKFLVNDPFIDLLFLDINMPQQSGIDFYRKLTTPPKVIFTTAYPNYAVEGFELNAVDYLLKPIAFERFLAAIQKVINVKAPHQKELEHLILNENKTLHKIKINDILYLEAYGDYVKVVCADKVVVTHSTFKNLITTLPDYFIRSHKSFCFNLNHLNQLSGNQVLIQSHKIPVGQTYKQKVLKALNISS